MKIITVESNGRCHTVYIVNGIWQNHIKIQGYISCACWETKSKFHFMKVDWNIDLHDISEMRKCRFHDDSIHSYHKPSSHYSDAKWAGFIKNLTTLVIKASDKISICLLFKTDPIVQDESCTNTAQSRYKICHQIYDIFLGMTSERCY